MFGQAETLHLTEYRLDHDHTNPYTDYVLKGKDSQGGQYNLGTGELEVLPEETLTVHRGGATVQLELPNLSGALVEVEFRVQTLNPHLNRRPDTFR